MGVGFLAGFSTGAIVGFASGDDESGWVRFTAAGKALIGGIALGTVGGITGLVIGAATGHKDIFILNDAHDYYPLVNAKLVEETADTIRFRWRDKTYQMNKSEIFIERKNERTNIYMTKKTFNRSVTKEPDEGDK
ncbi:hypothetical protein GWN26_03520 [Candidatus Saccharibacteria bacterium]|nr:hypothetical protein [Calditrichia bacterium]NIV98252.1 hypothetical protein [Candidatus Saccharibacteria bacterium]NIW80563.1 hypothetical protein [Calditrichia bacterium]